ncbi:MAG: vanadium nitrogenase [Eubacterium sp.]|nr:vanadium nitrogenase [Eubacterium sp.]
MAAVLGAFVKYIISFVFLVIVAGFGISCGIKLHDKDAQKKKEKES